MKTITPLNIRDYSTLSTDEHLAKPGMTGGEVLYVFTIVVVFFAGFVSYLNKNWTGLTLMVMAAIGVTFVSILSGVPTIIKESGKREAFLADWHSHFGHDGPTGALDSLYRSTQGGATHGSAVAIYQVDGVDYILSTATDGRLILEALE